MKWITQNKFLLSVCVIALLAFFCFRFFMQAIKSDHSMELYRQKMEYQEQARQAIIKERQAWEALSLEQTKQIITLQLRDSILSATRAQVENKISKISTPQYEKEKISPINNYGSTELLNYFNSLPDVPEPTDY